MLSRQISRRINEVMSSRCMATLVTSEEFATTPAVISQIRQAAVVTESTLASGTKIVSRDSGAPVRNYLEYRKDLHIQNGNMKIWI